MPPHWPSGLPFNQESIVVSGKVCEKYESDIREVFTEIQASITVIDQSTPSLKDRFQYYCSYYYFHK